MREAGRAGAAVSAGNTGALMAMAKLALRTCPASTGPALAAMLPTLGENDVVMLDLGANTECDARNLVQFAVMGAAYARTSSISNPPRAPAQHRHRGMKGTDEIRDAAAMLRAADSSAAALRRLHRGRQLVARRCRRDRVRRLFGQYRAQDGRGHRALRRRSARRAFTSSLRSKVGFLISSGDQLLRHISIRTITMARSSSASTASW
jgi:glycerol-3-phosphate acyltransferase PlsX